jgi:hypothetical protein
LERRELGLFHKNYVLWSNKTKNGLKNMSVLGRAFKVVLIWTLALLVGTFVENVADEVYGESGITYEVGHPTAYGGVRGWNPLKSLEIVGKMAIEYLEDLLKIGK